MGKKLRLLLCLVILTVFCLPLAATAYTAPAENQNVGFYYTVNEGDTQAKINNMFTNTPWQQVENDGIYATADKVYPGQALQLTRGQSAANMLPVTQNIIFHYPNIDGVNFIRKTPVRPVGEILMIQDKGSIAGIVGDLLKMYIAPQARLKIGDLLTVYTQLQSTDYRVTRDLGDKYEILGIVEVVRFDGTVAEVRIKKSYNPFVTGAKAVFYTPRDPEIVLGPSDYDVEGVVIGSDRNFGMMGAGMVAFVNKGAKNGLKPGQFYTMYETNSFVTVEPEPPTDNLLEALANKLNPQAVREIDTHDIIGEFIVIHTEDAASTIYILRSTRPIMDGTKFKAFVY